MNQSNSGPIDSVMHEDRLFAPNDEFASRARIHSMQEYEKLWEQAKADPEAFWDQLAKADPDGEDLPAFATHRQEQIAGP